MLDKISEEDEKINDHEVPTKNELKKKKRQQTS
jgi:hypothetical protein